MASEPMDLDVDDSDFYGSVIRSGCKAPLTEIYQATRTPCIAVKAASMTSMFQPGESSNPATQRDPSQWRV